MVAVQMADKNMIDPVEVYLQPHQLHLGCLTTIDQEVSALNFHEL